MTKITNLKQLDNLQSSTHFIEVNFGGNVAEIFNNDCTEWECIYKNVFKDLEKIEHFNRLLNKYGFDVELIGCE